MNGQVCSPPVVRIALVAFGGLLHDLILETLEAQPDMLVVEDVLDCPELERVIAANPADLVLLQVDGGDLPKVCPHIFDGHPTIKVLTIRDDGRHGFLWELLPSSSALGEVSPRILVDTIRRVMRR
jgi:hypothetical protein